eukprot:GHVU01085950.1.p2 GENE.GHVU01085950.1~~GHVU01085950.1.p2  ORF type:complete len:104 (-),score=16.33 GHVU01085950.1:47-358(-)
MNIRRNTYNGAASEGGDGRGCRGSDAQPLQRIDSIIIIIVIIIVIVIIIILSASSCCLAVQSIAIGREDGWTRSRIVNQSVSRSAYVRQSYPRHLLPRGATTD